MTDYPTSSWCIVLSQQLQAFSAELEVDQRSGGMIGPEISDSDLDKLQSIRQRAGSVEYSKAGIPLLALLRPYTHLAEYMEV
jgi:hypothetical protein